MEREILNAQWADAKQHYWAFRHGLGRPDVAAQLLEEILWQQGPVCPKCGLAKRSVLITEPSSTKPREWKCTGCAKVHSVCHGTWLQEEPATLDQVVFGVASIGLEGAEFAAGALSEQAGLSEADAKNLVQRIEEMVFAENGHPIQIAPARVESQSQGMPSRKPARRKLTWLTSIAGAALIWAWIYARPNFLGAPGPSHAAGIGIQGAKDQGAGIQADGVEDDKGEFLMDKWSYSVNGNPIDTKIVTKRRDFASPEDWHAAHRRSVILMKSQFPPTQ